MISDKVILHVFIVIFLLITKKYLYTKNNGTSAWSDLLLKTTEKTSWFPCKNFGLIDWLGKHISHEKQSNQSRNWNLPGKIDVQLNLFNTESLH